MNHIKHTIKGKVISDAMNKTIVVECTRLIKHPKYKKYLKRFKRYHAHDEENQCKKGDRVMIEATHPISKTKRWRVVKEKS